MNKRLWYFFVFTIIIAVFISPFASASPDGLERVALDLGFMELEKEPLYEIFPDYSLTFVSVEYVSTAISGLMGLFIITIPILGYWWMHKRRKTE